MVAPTHHLLVVDDEPYIGRIIRAQFERGPYQVSCVEDGPAALDFLAGHPDVDCIMLDLNMPGMSGVEVLERIRGNARYAAVPALVLTAAGQIGQVEQARALGATAIVTKPFSPKKLYRQVAELLGDDPDAELGGEG